jgi:hypothetical protein
MSAFIFQMSCSSPGAFLLTLGLDLIKVGLAADLGALCVASSLESLGARAERSLRVGEKATLDSLAHDMFLVARVSSGGGSQSRNGEFGEGNHGECLKRVIGK